MFKTLILGLSLLLLTMHPTLSLASYNQPGFQKHKKVILEAADRSGLDAGLITAVAAKESNLGKNTINPKSSARGVMQTTSRTWRVELAQHHKKLGLAKNASVNNPRANILVSSMAMADDRAFLQANTKKKVTSGDVYMARFLGRNGAKAVIRGNPNAPISKYVKLHKGNGGMYYVKGKVATVAQFRAKMQGIVDSNKRLYAADLDRAKFDKFVERIANGHNANETLLAMRL